MPSDGFSEKNIALTSSYLNEIGTTDHELLHHYGHPYFSYHGSITYHFAKDYLKVIKDHSNSPAAEVLVNIEIKSIFADENDCCVIYDTVSRFQGKKVSFAECVKIEDGKFPLQM